MFKSVNAEYRVVDFQEPVGQEVRIIPFGKEIAFWISLRFFHSIQSSVNFGIVLDLSTILITTFSQ
ncbi:MAG: hypothetical protein LBC61_06555 [Candidatus Peribacteria bacterium]|nr:hypothetical protein [Candidatus Peribacteria bacterium]